MKKLILLISAFYFALAAMAQEQPDRTTLVKVGDTVPSFEVTMLDGSKINIEALRGKVVVVNFWATWCPPCCAEFKRVPREIVKKFADEDFVFLPISRGEKRETVETFSQKEGYKFPMGLDPESAIFKLFATTSIPRNFVIDRDGVIVLCEMGYTPELFDHLVNVISKTIKNK